IDLGRVDVAADRVGRAEVADVVAADLDALTRDVGEAVVAAFRHVEQVDGTTVHIEHVGQGRFDVHIDDAYDLQRYAQRRQHTAGPPPDGDDQATGSVRPRGSLHCDA